MKAPVNVESLAEALSISIEHQDLDDSVSGFLVKKDGRNIIGLNQRHPEVRKRFTISHEIGHFKLHVDTPLFVDFYKGSMLYRTNHKRQDYKMEKEANTFAAALLMPQSLISNEISKMSDDMDYDSKLLLLSQKFEVSQQAMDFRLKTLGHYDYGF
ncbi:MAG: ImmA/IrrE family metallo-endopeptidase [Maribacter dokdonensis]